MGRSVKVLVPATDAAVAAKGSASLAAGDNTTVSQAVEGGVAKVKVRAVSTVKKGVAQGPFSRKSINLIDGTGVTITVADDAGGDAVNVTVAATANGSVPAVGCDAVTTILASSANTHYERHPDQPSVIRLRSPNNFPTARAIAAASPEYGWTWLNRGLLTTADENTTTANGVYGDHDATNTDWNAAAPTCPARYQTVSFTGGTLEVVGLCYNNGNAAWESTGIVLARDGAKGTFVKCWVGHNGASVRASSNQNIGGGVTSNGGAAIAAGEQTAGVWLKIVATATMVTTWFHRTASAEPPKTGWEFLQVYTSATALYGVLSIGHLWLTVNVANHLTGGILWFGWQTYPGLPRWQGGLPGFQATRRATAGDNLALIASADFTNAVLPSTTKMRLILADAVNRLPEDAGTWTFGLTGSDSDSTPEAPPTMQSAAALVLKQDGTDTTESTARRYWALYATCASTNGEQDGSIDVSLVKITA